MFWNLELWNNYIEVWENYIDLFFKKIKWKLCFCRSYNYERELWKKRHLSNDDLKDN